MPVKPFSEYNGSINVNYNQINFLWPYYTFDTVDSRLTSHKRNSIVFICTSACVYLGCRQKCFQYQLVRFIPVISIIQGFFGTWLSLYTLYSLSSHLNFHLVYKNIADFVNFLRENDFEKQPVLSSNLSWFRDIKKTFYVVLNITQPSAPYKY